MSIATIRIKGAQSSIQKEPEHLAEVQLKASFEVGPAQRALGQSHEIDLQADDMVEFVFSDNISWVAATDDIKTIFGKQIEQKNRSTGAVIWEIPELLPSDEQQRGLIGDVALKVVKIFSKKERTYLVQNKVKFYAENLQKKQLNNQSGVYRLDQFFQLQSYRQANTSRPILLFLHGTASSTHSSFEALKGSVAWDFICKNYKEDILAFQHETLTKSPLQNVLELMQQLPDNCRLHLVSHSRGGLVGDVLSRFCVSNQHAIGFSETEIAYLKKCKRYQDCTLIDEITALAKHKNIRVEKFVRVACPANGTSLASHRLDYLFNVLVNVMGLAVGSVANPVFVAFKDMLSVLVESKDNINLLPGLEAMNPDSPFIKVLNNPAPQATIDGQLMVISGNSKLNLSFKSLAVLASKLFFNAKNDLVVDTDSMYHGAKRSAPIQCFFDEQGNVDHFHYFSNKRSNEALMAALRWEGNTVVPGFTLQQQQFADMSMRNAVLQLEGGQVYRDTVSGTRPIVILLPGIMGSNLSNDGDLIWINYLRFVRGELKSLEFTETNNSKIAAPSLVKTSYKDLTEFLGKNYDVVTFPFDWRRQLKESASLLNSKIVELMQYGQSIKIVGHSMGGVLVRDFIVQHPQTWQQLNQSENFKLLFLGSPLGGSYRIPYVLFGFDDIIAKIAKIDLFHTKKELLQVFCNLPGLLSLLPLTKEEENDFAQLKTWQKMSQALGDNDWPLPSKKVLEEFGKYRDEINSRMTDIDWRNAVYIAGRDVATPSGYSVVDDKLIFNHTAAGDQSVTWETGIPKQMIALDKVYYANVSHGALSCSAAIFEPISDILSKGFTNQLVKKQPLLRSTTDAVSAPSLDYDLSPQGLEKTLLGLSFEEFMPSGEPPLKVSVSNGDLRFARYPVLVGHFQKDAILNAEKAIDKNLKGSLSELHRLGLYPGAIGTSEILRLPQDVFQGAIIVGLGEQGALTAFQLSQTVEQAIAKYLVSVNNPLQNNNATNQELGVSALLIGCGYGGLSIDNSIRAIIQGVQNANKRIQLLRNDAQLLIGHVEFVELYEDKALSSLYTLYKISEEQSQSLNIQLADKFLKRILGSKERLPIENTDAWWSRITVRKAEVLLGQTTHSNIRFNITTGAAREEERSLLTNSVILEELLQEMSVQNRWSAEMAKTIFELLIPNDFKEQLKKQNNINWIVDTHTAGIPWELLQDEAVNAQPLAVNAGMIRQLATQDYRVQVQQVTENNAFVLADPDLKGFVFQLPAAKAEGDLVQELLTTHGFNSQLVGLSPGNIIKQLFSKSYKILHLAGHGVFDKDNPQASGMLIGKEVYLSTQEIAQMSQVPELVFVNCCYLGKIDGEAESLYQYRYKLAANIGTQLISIGVKAVVVAGWAVDDNAAHDFTQCFYEKLLDGYNFGEAVLYARKFIYQRYQMRNNTWGAYQCYGDPFYKLMPDKIGHNKNEYRFVIAREAEIELNNLVNKLELSGISESEHLAQLEAISVAVDNAKLRNATITETEAKIYNGLRMYQQSADKYAQLIDEENACFSFSAMEQYCSVRIKNALQIFATDSDKRKESIQQAQIVIKDLEVLKSYSATTERLILLGSSYRRLALLQAQKTAKIKCYEQAADFFFQAFQKPNGANKIHAFCSWVNMEQLLVLQGKRKWGQQLDQYKLWKLAEIENQLQQFLKDLDTAPNELQYWDMVAKANIKTTLFVVGNKQIGIETIVAEYQNLWRHAGASGKKQSEIEVCELMIDALRHLPNAQAQDLASAYIILKSELVKLL